jgi:hypothetical protein
MLCFKGGPCFARNSSTRSSAPETTHVKKSLAGAPASQHGTHLPGTDVPGSIPLIRGGEKIRQPKEYLASGDVVPASPRFQMDGNYFMGIKTGPLMCDPMVTPSSSLPPSTLPEVRHRRTPPQIVYVDPFQAHQSVVTPIGFSPSEKSLSEGINPRPRSPLPPPFQNQELTFS